MKHMAWNRTMIEILILLAFLIETNYWHRWDFHLGDEIWILVWHRRHRNSGKMCVDESKTTVSIITLGDGDFTYSLDLARYISHDDNHNVELICTGIDTHEELLAKYKDAPYVLGQLHALKSSRLSISVKHGVNAILNSSDHGVHARTIGQGDHVMFHHPHLGTEDAALHGRFLCHFFHSCVNGWMKAQGGLVHLTLVNGQYERWNCEQAASSQGLKLLHRKPFVPPPVKNPTYHLRRHQTGKSFESRRPSGSEAFLFGRKEDQQLDFLTSLLSWQPVHQSCAVIKQKASQLGNTLPTIQPLECPFCDRVFKEDRSRKCHIRDKHPDGAEKKTKIESSILFYCVQCNTATGGPRSFDDEKGLKDHVRAKHSAIHKTVTPDWCKLKQIPSSHGGTEKIEMPVAYSCGICGGEWQSKDQELSHLDDFRPCFSDKEFRCMFCSKAFREIRAKMQHENFCSSTHKWHWCWPLTFSHPDSRKVPKTKINYTLFYTVIYTICDRKYGTRRRAKKSITPGITLSHRISHR